MLKVHQFGLRLRQEALEGALHVLIEEGVKEEACRICCSGIKRPPHPPHLEASGGFPPLPKGAPISIISIEDAHIMPACCQPRG
jgi:hypothetical protein